MASKTEKPTCYAYTKGDFRGNVPCSCRGKVERDGKWYCGKHDPIAVEARLQRSVDALRTKIEERSKRVPFTSAELAAQTEITNDSLTETAYGWAIKRGDGTRAEFLGKLQAEGALRRLSSGMASESEFDWTV